MTGVWSDLYRVSERIKRCDSSCSQRGVVKRRARTQADFSPRKRAGKDGIGPSPCPLVWVFSGTKYGRTAQSERKTFSNILWKQEHRMILRELHTCCVQSNEIGQTKNCGRNTTGVFVSLWRTANQSAGTKASFHLLRVLEITKVTKTPFLAPHYCLCLTMEADKWRGGVLVIMPWDYSTLNS